MINQDLVGKSQYDKKEKKITEYVIVPQHITGDFSENGCLGKTMEKITAQKIYGKKIIETLEALNDTFESRKTCTKACEIKQKHGVVCNFNFGKQNEKNVSYEYLDKEENMEDTSDDISSSEENMAMWGY